MAAVRTVRFRAADDTVAPALQVGGAVTFPARTCTSPPPALLVQVWLARPRAPGALEQVEAREPMLSEAEHRRLSGTESAVMRAQRLCAYRLRRQALGRVLGMPADQVGLHLGEDGRAEVEGAGDATVSLSHTDGLVAVAVARGGRVGVDVERIRARRDVVATAGRCFHPDEAAWLARAPAAQRLREFFRLWCKKESLGKASGRGLFGALGERVEDGPRWRFVELTVPDSHAAALVVDRPSPSTEIRMSVTGGGPTWIEEGC
jgi:phosphopantetheinyl transferase